MTTIYRVEHKESRLGPYHCNRNFLTEELDSLLKIYEQPTVCKDKSKTYPNKKFNLWTIPLDVLFGFETTESLKNWFNEELRSSLTQCNFILAKYVLKEEDITFNAFEKQCWFHSDYYERVVSDISLKNL